jgi:signal transduction histidine kinase
VSNFRAAGLPVSVSVTGAPRELTPGLDLAGYRLVQEGLTNSLRHARNPRCVEVVVNYGTDRLDIVVRDDGQAAVEPLRAATGAGLTGMRERVALYDGSLATRTRPDGGFEMLASLPVEPG